MLHDLLLTCPNDFFVGLVRYLFDWSVGTKKQSDDKKMKRDGGQIENDFEISTLLSLSRPETSSFNPFSNLSNASSSNSSVASAPLSEIGGLSQSRCDVR